MTYASLTLYPSPDVYPGEGLNLGDEPRIAVHEARWLAAEVNMHDGDILRAGPDERDTVNVPTHIEFETARKGGFGPATIVLPRPVGFDVEDAWLFADTRIYDSADRTAHEGRVTGTPHTGVNEVEIQVEGWGNHMGDNGCAHALIADQSLNSWQGMTTALRALLVPPTTFAYWDPESDWDTMVGQPALRLHLEGAWASSYAPFCEAYYDAGPGSRVGGLYSEALNMVTGTTIIDGYSQDDDIGTGITGIFSTSAGSITINATIVSKRWLRLRVYAATPGGTDGVDYNAFFKKLTVRGDHGLTVYGDGPGGYLVSDVIPYLVGRYAPLLNVDTQNIEKTSFPVPHAVWLDDVTLTDMVEGLLLFGGNSVYPLDWSVWEDRGFFLRSPDNPPTQWRVRRDEGTQSLDSGPDSQERLNGIKVKYSDGSEKTKSVGPIGSGSDFETVALEDRSLSNPANRIGGVGTPKWKTVDAGTTTQPGAILMGQQGLVDANLQLWRGTVDVAGPRGQVRNADQEELPVYMIRGGDAMVVEDDGPYTAPRLLESTSFSGDANSRDVSCTIGAAPDRFDVLAARAASRVAVLT